MPSASTRPVKVRYHSTDLCCDVRRTVGFEAYCACGYEGPTRKTPDLARWDKRVHLHKEHRQ